MSLSRHTFALLFVFSSIASAEPPAAAVPTAAPTAVPTAPATPASPGDAFLKGIEAKDFVELLETDPPVGKIITWDKESRRLLYSSDGMHFFLYLSGSVRPGYGVMQNDQTIPLAPDSTFRVKIDVPIEPATIVWKVQSDDGNAFTYRLSTIWKKYPPGSALLNLNNDQPLTQSGSAFKGTIKDAGFAQLYRTGNATQSLSYELLDTSTLTFRLFAPPIAQRPAAWALLVQTPDHGRKSIAGMGEPPASVQWSKIPGEMDAPGVYSYRLVLRYDGRDRVGMGNKFVFHPHTPHYFSPSVGGTFVSYSDPSVLTYNGFAITVKAAYERPLFPQIHIDGGIDAFMTLVPLTNNPADANVRFLGGNLRLGFTVPIPGPVKLRLSTGFSYLTTLTSGNFGFKSFTSIFLAPAILCDLEHGSSIVFYGKVAPRNAGIFSFNFSEAEFAGGAYYEFLLPNDHPLFFGADFSMVQATTDSASTASAMIITVSGGYRF